MCCESPQQFHIRLLVSPVILSSVGLAIMGVTDSEASAPAMSCSFLDDHQSRMYFSVFRVSSMSYDLQLVEWLQYVLGTAA